MKTQNKLVICISISYFIGMGIGYILKTDNISPISTKIISILFGLGFSVYVVAQLLFINR